MTHTVSGWWHLVQHAQNMVHDGWVGGWLDPCADLFLKGAFAEILLPALPQSCDPFL